MKGMCTDIVDECTFKTVANKLIMIQPCIRYACSLGYARNVVWHVWLCHFVWFGHGSPVATERSTFQRVVFH